jgi:hypothetical protein
MTSESMKCLHRRCNRVEASGEISGKYHYSPTCAVWSLSAMFPIQSVLIFDSFLNCFIWFCPDWKMDKSIWDI